MGRCSAPGHPHWMLSHETPHQHRGCSRAGLETGQPLGYCSAWRKLQSGLLWNQRGYKEQELQAFYRILSASLRKLSQEQKKHVFLHPSTSPRQPGLWAATLQLPARAV